MSPYRTPLAIRSAPLLFLGLSIWTVYFGVSANATLSFEIGGLLGIGAIVYVVTSRGKRRTPIEVDE